jgi:predicted enzyme related to lactoylglutathione lyase
MFRNSKAFSGFSVHDLQKAKQFYSHNLKIDVVQDEDMPILTLRLAGGNNVILYEKENHIPATFTVLNFPVDNIDEAVRELKSHGIGFEAYDYPGLVTDEDNIMRGNGPNIAWFKDPSGNILSVIES